MVIFGSLSQRQIEMLNQQGRQLTELREKMVAQSTARLSTIGPERETAEQLTTVSDSKRPGAGVVLAFAVAHDGKSLAWSESGADPARSTPNRHRPTYGGRKPFPDRSEAFQVNNVHCTKTRLTQAVLSTPPTFLSSPELLLGSRLTHSTKLI